MAPFATHGIVALALATLATISFAHGLLASPRVRGALKSDYSNLHPQTIDESAEQDFCAVCQNGGGIGVIVSGGNGFAPYEPLEGNFRPSVGICGDHSGHNDHMKSGRFANPKSTPFVKEWTAGSVVSLEYYVSEHHGGYLEMYLCDVTNNPGQDIQKETFGQDCHKLMREPDQWCESGRDTECGPIDPRYPGRWVLPCSNPAPGGGQVFGGENGKMAYRLPDVEMEVAVLHSYWAASHFCTPDAFMLDYNYPEAWGDCPGDGGSIGGKPQHVPCQESNRFPEEFWGCSDVTVRIRGSKSGESDFNKESQSNQEANPSDGNDGNPKNDSAPASQDSNDSSNVEQGGNPGSQNGVTGTNSNGNTWSTEGGDSGAQNGNPGSQNGVTGTNSNGNTWSTEGGDSGAQNGDAGPHTNGDTGSFEGRNTGAQNGDSGGHNDGDTEFFGGSGSSAKSSDGGVDSSGETGFSEHGSGTEGKNGGVEPLVDYDASSQPSNLRLRVYEAGVANDQSKEGPVLNDGMTFCPRGENENITLRCIGVNEEIVNTVTFFINDKIVWIEGVAPYAIAGDSDRRGIAARWEDIPQGKATVSCVTDYGDSTSATVNFAC